MALSTDHIQFRISLPLNHVYPVSFLRYYIITNSSRDHKQPVMLILILVLKDSLRTKFKSLSLSLPVQSLTSPIP